MTHLANQSATSHADKGRDHAVPPRPIARYTAPPMDEDALRDGMMRAARTAPKPHKTYASPATDAVTRLLKKHGELTIADLAYKMGKSQASVRPTLKRMRAEGLAEAFRRHETDIWRLA